MNDDSETPTPAGAPRWCLALVLSSACYSGLHADGAQPSGGADDEAGGASEAGDSGDVPQPPSEDGVGPMGMRRLSVRELDRALRELVGDDTAPASTYLKEDTTDPFDNDFMLQSVDKNLIESVEQMTTDVVARLVADAPRLAGVVGCEPAGDDPSACLTEFVARFGRRALRRPLTEAEVALYVGVATAEIESVGEFAAGVGLVLRALLQDAEFLYRIERGTPTDVPGIHRLDGYEIATRMSFLVWGTPPDDALLDHAEAGELETPEGRREILASMWADPRAREQLDRYHAMWLGYSVIYLDAMLVDALRQETRLLLDKVVFEDGDDWLSIFTADGTFIDATLAEHYGLPAPAGGGFAWVDYGDSTRRGILGHGTFLSVNGKFGDTSPTMRGKFIRKRLFCMDIELPEPDPQNPVNADQPPPDNGSPCKWDRYAAHREKGTSCAACHALLDAVGFGLENYDQAGKYRTTDAGLPQCTITGQGDLDGAEFVGPAGLAALLDGRDEISDCAARHLYRYAMGRKPAPTDPDERYVSDLSKSLRDSGTFDVVLADLIGDEAFAFRREEM